MYGAVPTALNVRCCPYDALRRQSAVVPPSPAASNEGAQHAAHVAEGKSPPTPLLRVSSPTSGAALPPPRPSSGVASLSVITTMPSTSSTSYLSSPAPAALSTPDSAPRTSVSRGRSFGGGSGGTATMFASSPQGARAARRARSFIETNSKTPSVWGADQDGSKRVATSSSKGAGDTEGSITLSESSTSPTLPRSTAAEYDLDSTGRRYMIMTTNSQQGGGTVLSGILRESSPVGRTTSRGRRITVTFDGSSLSLPESGKEPSDDALGRLHHPSGRYRSPPPAQVNLSVRGSVPVAVQQVAACGTPLTRRQMARLTSPAPSSVALARVGLFQGSTQGSDSDSPLFGGGNEIADDCQRSYDTPRRSINKRVRRTVGGLGPNLGNIGGGLGSGAECSEGVGAEQSSPGSAFSFNASPRSTSARSISSRSSGAGDSELSVNTDSSEGTMRSSITREVEQRRLAALVAAARKIRPHRAHDTKNCSSADAVNRMPALSDVLEPTRTAFSTDHPDEDEAGPAVVARRRTTDYGVILMGKTPHGTRQPRQQHRGGRDFKPAEPILPPSRLDRGEIDPKPAAAAPLKSSPVQASISRPTNFVQVANTRPASGRHTSASSPPKARLLSRAGAAVTRVLVRPSAANGLSTSAGTHVTANKSGELPLSSPRREPRRSADGGDMVLGREKSVLGTTAQRSLSSPRPQDTRTNVEGNDVMGMMSTPPRLDRSVDDPPPAEMGALGSSLSCALCGAAESKSRASSRSAADGRSPRNGVVSSKLTGDEAAGDGGGAGSMSLEFQRCSRCRRGCCGKCIRRLPVYCRGPRAIVPGVMLIRPSSSLSVTYPM